MNFEKKKQIRKFFSTFLLGVYFLALFSQSFHEHSFNQVFQNFNLKKTENNISKNISKEQSGDCLACHFLATGNAELPIVYDCSFAVYTQKVEQIISVQEKIWEQTKYTFQLRGPPENS